ncbi:MAG: FAD-binding oxidoreductase [Syntrophales bacterium]|nr:FAD-binding oxidoreductase [Syntrophales bacterium]
MEQGTLMNRNLPDLFDSWESYRETCRELSHAMAGRAGNQVRLAKKTSNLFRTRREAAAERLDVRRLRRVIEIDPERRIAEVEGMTTFEDFTDAALSKDLRPPVVPELKTITVGGAVSGVGIEASSFRYGLMHETVEEMEILCGDGTIRICRPDNENADLFHAVPNSYGTLGYILRLRVRLLPASPFIQLTHRRFTDRAPFLATLVTACAQGPDAPDFVEGVAFTPDDFVLTTARQTQEGGPVSNYKEMQIYYHSLRNRTEDLLTIRDFLWRWDPDWFWCSRSFGMQNPLLRRLLGRWMLRSRSYWKIQSWYRKWNIEERVNALREALHLPVERLEPVIQDVEIPIEKSPEFLDFYFREINIRPCWICPLRPLAAAADWTLFAMKPGALYLNFGFWGSVPSSSDKPPGHFNRRIERIVQALGGRKSLYSQSFFPEDEFRRLYNGDAYQTLKAKFDPQRAFGDLYQKTVLRH